MTYNELFIAVKNYLQNDFPTETWTNVAGTGTSTSSGTNQINLFIEQAEERIYNTVLLPALRKNVTGVVQPNNRYLSCPTDFLAVLSMAVISANRYEYLLNKDVNFLRAAYPNPNDTGLPRYYALFGPEVINQAPTRELSFILAPTPNAAYSVELHYYYYPTSIVTAGSSWLGDNYSPVLLYGSLVEAYIYMKGETDMMATYEKKYQDALQQLIRLGAGMERGDAYRDGQAKVKVMP